MSQLTAQAVISPEFSAAIVAMAFSQSHTIDQQARMEQLRAQHAMHFIESPCFNKEPH
ncbi:hypothetical protein [Polaromonas sp.]|uniref:hypothetical protein n=1 Tax=Polaromonas sp. TaxID=1869339 RepID=UPI00182651F5|nr:hypothetical protein [Polaromonas sp.]NMM06015.1 hypothetical protein [Polaromonas sp.]